MNKTKSTSNTRLSRRLLVRVFLVMFLVTGLSGVAHMYVTYTFEQKNRDISIRYAISNLLPLLEKSLWIVDHSNIKAISVAFLRNPYITGVDIRDELGTLETQGSTIENIDLPEMEDIQLSHHSARKSVLVFQLIIKRERFNIGFLTLYSDENIILEQLMPVLRVILISWLVTLITLGGFIFWVQQSVVAQPIHHLIKAIHQLNPKSSDQSSEPISTFSLKKRNDEIGDMFRTFDEMKDGILERDEQLRYHQQILEVTVDTRTKELRASNTKLGKSLEHLRIAQDELVESEKMASLGGLVAGVAHEVNTPLGISITAITHIQQETCQFGETVKAGGLKKSELDNFINLCSEGSQIIVQNLDRAAKLIANFKEVAVDQSTEEKRNINLAHYIEELLTSLKPKFKHTKVVVSTDLDESIFLNTYPGALAQVITNIMMNSLIHGFKEGHREGNLNLQLDRYDDWINLTLRDDGLGMSSETTKQVFEPFYTTRKGSGGTGLGMHIVYNLVTQKLGGTIKCKSKEGKGTIFIICLENQSRIKT